MSDPCVYHDAWHRTDKMGVGLTGINIRPHAPWEVPPALPGGCKNATQVGRFGGNGLCYDYNFVAVTALVLLLATLLRVSAAFCLLDLSLLLPTLLQSASRTLHSRWRTLGVHPNPSFPQSFTASVSSPQPVKTGLSLSSPVTLFKLYSSPKWPNSISGTKYHLYVNDSQIFISSFKLSQNLDSQTHPIPHLHVNV